MTTPIAQSVDTLSGRTSTSNFITITKNRAPTGNDGINNGLQVGQRWIDTAAGNAEYFLLDFISFAGTVQANWAQLGSGTFTTETLTGNSGQPAASYQANINVVGDGTTGLLFSGSGSTLTGTLASIPNSALAHSSITLVAGTGVSITTSPVSLGGSTTLSVGGSVPDAFVTDSGTATPSANSLTIHGTGGLTTSGSGSTVTINSSALFSSTAIQVITTTGIYTPAVGLIYCIVEVIGGGGAGASTSATTISTVSVGGGGGAGEYRRGTYSAATIGASQTVTIGAAGTPGVNGGNTIFGALITANGGTSGGTEISGGTYAANGNSGGTGGSGGSFYAHGGGGSAGFGNTFAVFGGSGGSSYFGGSGTGIAGIVTGYTDGNVGAAFGAGGSGAITGTSAGSGNTGGNGFAGVVIVTEFI